VKGGRPKDLTGYRPVSEGEVTLWIPEGMSFSGDVIRFRRGSLRRRGLFFADGAFIP
jgi:hypothetical protein